MRKLFFTKDEKNKLNDFKLGQVDILNWLELQFQKELSEIENIPNKELLRLKDETIDLIQAKQTVFEFYLQNIKKIKEQIKNG